MDIHALVENMSEEMYLRLKCAAETGKWPEGTEVAQAQRDSALQITMAYQAKHLNNDENMTIGADGQIVTKTKRELKAQFATRADEPDSGSTKDDSKDIARFSNL